MNTSLRHRLVAFVGTGVVGFVVDGGLLTLLTYALAWNVYAARTVSFPVATLVTWSLNRRFAFSAFQSQRKGHEYVRYLVVQIVGAGINLGCFAAVLAVYPWMREVPIIPLFVGALVALTFNYAGSRYFAFRGG